MINQVVLVGRICGEPNLEIINETKKICKITLAVPRSYKNTNGEYETDFLECRLWNCVAENVNEYCKSGDIVGIKGRLQSRLNEATNEIKMEVIAEKVSFIKAGKDEK